MKNLLINLYELAAAMLPFFIVYALLSKKPKKLEHFIMAFIFACYIFAVYHLTNTGTLYDLLVYKMSHTADIINFEPFSMTIDWVGYLQNILLFIPFGMLLPLFFKRPNFLLCTLSGTLFSLMIECSQLLNKRSSDVDDLIMNTLGALIGYLLYNLILERLLKGKLQNLSRLEPLFYILAMFAGRFFLYNELGLAKILYGF